MPEIQSLFAHAGSLFAHAAPVLAALGRSLRATSPENLLLAGRAAFLVFSFAVAAVSFTRWRRAAERDTAHTAQQLSSMIERLERIERLSVQNEPRLTALGEQLEAHLRAGAAPGANYPIAIRLAHAGSEPEELMSSCGLTRQEAELVARLHGRRKDPPGSARPALRGRSAAA